ncbi:uncharacterized protein LOC122059790 [Macadamia integrifolia]|uniref:uncharacterized protein LOC122059790 n=1 Tax=Macadamia integrifolia TaxID=60698 RepID=UPI001C528B90|nr:uncharacterized protein LOC122059790 [Macadamia integrifolia]
MYKCCNFSFKFVFYCRRQEISVPPRLPQHCGKSNLVAIRDYHFFSMAKRRAKKNVPKTSTKLAKNLNDAHEEPQAKMQQDALRDHEVERQIAATRAIHDLETELLLTGLRLLRSNFKEEQLQTPVLQFFKENLPNLSVVRIEKEGQFEVEWKDKDGNLSMSHTDERNLHAHLSYNGCPWLIRIVLVEIYLIACSENKPFGSCKRADSRLYSGGAVRYSNAWVTRCLPNSWVSNHRLSVGMTTKTLRLPKHGEMLLSVRGLPLGVYKEDDMEAIHES